MIDGLRRLSTESTQSTCQICNNPTTKQIRPSKNSIESVSREHLNFQRGLTYPKYGTAHKPYPWPLGTPLRGDHMRNKLNTTIWRGLPGPRIRIHQNRTQIQHHHQLNHEGTEINNLCLHLKSQSYTPST